MANYHMVVAYKYKTDDPMHSQYELDECTWEADAMTYDECMRFKREYVRGHSYIINLNVISWQKFESDKGESK